MLSIRARIVIWLVKKLVKPKLSNSSVEEMRAFMEETAIGAPRKSSVEAVNVEHMPAEWISMGNVDQSNVVLHLHGGGYALGSLNSHRNLAAKISKYSHTKVLLVEYRLAPEHPYPTAIDDAVIAYQWLLNNGYCAQNIAISGDSAGGGLAVSTMIALRNKGIPLPAAAVCLSPWTDLSLTSESMINKAPKDPMITIGSMQHLAKSYAGENDLKLSLISPVYADLTGLPSLLIHVGENEVLLDDAIRLHDEAIKKGVDATLNIASNMFHVWHVFSSVMPEAKVAMKEVGGFIHKHVNADIF